MFSKIDNDHCSSSSIGEEVNCEVLYKVSGAEPEVRIVAAVRKPTKLISSKPVAGSQQVFNFPRKPRTPRMYMEFKHNTRDKIVRDLFLRGGMRLVIEKSLYKSDLNKGLNRLSMPPHQLLIEPEELFSVEENAALSRKIVGAGGGKTRLFEGIKLSFWDTRLRETTMFLKKWAHKRKYIFSYMLTNNWFKVASDNRLKKDDVVQFWFFRDGDGNPCFALVNLGKNHEEEDNDHDHHITKKQKSVIDADDVFEVEKKLSESDSSVVLN